MTRPMVFLTSSMILLGLAACEPVPTNGTANARPLVTVPESVSSIAAPYQDLTTARSGQRTGVTGILIWVRSKPPNCHCAPRMAARSAPDPPARADCGLQASSVCRVKIGGDACVHLFVKRVDMCHHHAHTSRTCTRSDRAWCGRPMDTQVGIPIAQIQVKRA